MLCQTTTNWRDFTPKSHQMGGILLQNPTKWEGFPAQNHHKWEGFPAQNHHKWEGFCLKSHQMGGFLLKIPPNGRVFRSQPPQMGGFSGPNHHKWVDFVVLRQKWWISWFYVRNGGFRGIWPNNRGIWPNIRVFGQISVYLDHFPAPGPDSGPKSGHIAPFFSPVDQWDVKKYKIYFSFRRPLYMHAEVLVLKGHPKSCTRDVTKSVKITTFSQGVFVILREKCHFIPSSGPVIWSLEP